MSNDLLTEIHAYLDQTGMTPNTFCKLAANNWRLLERLENGEDVTTRTAARVRAFIAENQHRRGRRRKQAAE